MELNPSQLLGPFLSAVGQIQSEAKKALGLPLTSEQRELLESLSAELMTQRARFEEAGPPFIEEGRKQIQENERRLQALLRQKDDLLLEMGQLRRGAEEVITKAERDIRDQSAQSGPVAARPQTKLTEKSARLALSPGSQLRDLLTSTTAGSPPSSRQPKRIGNIWEDWTQWQAPSETPSSEEFPEEEGNRPPG